MAIDHIRGHLGSVIGGDVGGDGLARDGAHLRRAEVPFARNDLRGLRVGQLQSGFLVIIHIDITAVGHRAAAIARVLRVHLVDLVNAQAGVGVRFVERKEADADRKHAGRSEAEHGGGDEDDEAFFDRHYAGAGMDVVRRRSVRERVVEN